MPKRAIKTWLTRLGRRLALGRLSDPDSPIPLYAAMGMALLVLLALGLLYLAVPSLRPGYWPGAFVEATGFLFDLLFFGVVLALLISWRETKREGQRYRDEIQDFKQWDTDEGHLRIAGAIRRLVRLGKTDIDLRGARISNFSFRLNDIKSIRGASFYEGEWGTLSSREKVSLTKVDFSFVDCSDVCFSRVNPYAGLYAGRSGIRPPVKIIDCSFQDANLRGAVFQGASLEWPDVPPDTLDEKVEDPDGSVEFVQIVHPAFDGADLAGASFREADFRNADFRCARNILEADFSGAQGLESCVFDDDTVREAVMKNSSGGAS